MSFPIPPAGLPRLPAARSRRNSPPVNAARFSPLGLLAAAALAVFAPAAARAQYAVYRVLHNFTGNPEGGSPRTAPTQGSDGNFYGVTLSEGTGGMGTIYRVDPQGVFTTLHSFTGPDGAFPQAALIEGADGDFYGTTYAAGDNGADTVFQITPAGSLATFTTLYSFTDGQTPRAGLLRDADGNFYGTTGAGGANRDGTIFRLSPAGVLTTLHDFDGDGGSTPSAGLIRDAEGNFYGTASSGGMNGKGVVFRLSAGGTFTVLHSFSGFPDDGSDPATPLIDGGDGFFYGTTIAGGGSNEGSAFRIAPDGTFKLIFSFGHN